MLIEVLQNETPALEFDIFINESGRMMFEIVSVERNRES